MNNVQEVADKKEMNTEIIKKTKPMSTGERKRPIQLRKKIMHFPKRKKSC